MPHRLVKKLIGYPAMPPPSEIVSKEEFDAHIEDEERKRQQLEQRLRVVEMELPAIIRKKKE